MSRAAKRSRLSTIRDINMTPLIDLTFLLLIVFMITVPLMEYAVDVSPPEMNADPLPEDKSLVVNLNNRGEIFLDKIMLTELELTDALKSKLTDNPKLTVMFRADGDRLYREVMNVMKAIKNAGVKDISLITQAESD